MKTKSHESTAKENMNDCKECGCCLYHSGLIDQHIEDLKRELERLQKYPGAWHKIPEIIKDIKTAQEVYNGTI